MTLAEIFNQLAYGELSQLSVVNSETGLLDSSKYPQFVSHVNLGLTALYKRFPLKEGRVTFSLEPGKVTYPITTTEDVNFVVGVGEEDFTDDILKIERVYTDKGIELPLNDLADLYSCTTPSATVLRVPIGFVTSDADLPDEYITSTLTAVYRANHPLIKVTGSSFNPSRVNVELPMSHLEPLLLFVASRVNNPVGMTNEFHAGNSYAKKYEQACQQLEVTNLRVDKGSQNTGIYRGGWV